MHKVTILLFLVMVFLRQSPGDCMAQQQPREGYVNTSDGVRLYYKIIGSGTETLVAVHGGPGNTMESILPDLEPLARNRRVIYYDQRGNGRSDLLKAADKLSISKHVEDLETVRTFFKLDKMTLLGNSWGGLLISYYAVAHPDRVQRMILHSPAEPTREFAVEAGEEIQQRIDQRYDAAQRKRYRVVSNPQTWVQASDPRAICREFFRLLLPVYVVKPENLKLLKGDVCSGSEEAVRYQQVVNTQILKSLGNWNLLPKLGTVKAPILVIHGAADPIPVESSKAWARAFSNARLLVIEGAGHIPQVEQPEIFFGAVETFLKDTSPDPKQTQAFGGSARSTASSNSGYSQTVSPGSVNSAPVFSETLRQTTLKTVDGESLRLSDFANKVVVVNIWATWCPPCLREMPSLSRMNTAYKSRGVVFLGLATTYNEHNDARSVRAYLRRQRINYKSIWDDGTLAGPLVDAVHGRGVIPQSFVIGKDGHIMKHFQGFNPTSSPRLMRAAIQDALKGSPN